MLNNKIILITGGTGSFGQKFTEVLLKEYNPELIRIFSRDEFKQYEMERKFKSDKRVRFLVGDIRDKDRLARAMDGVDIVVHAAALKHVPSCEYNPFEAVQTNILGAQNVINTAIDCNVERVIALSTDKAVNPINLYGASKMCMEKIFTSANTYIGPVRRTKISCVRYGNVLGSRGSVVPLFDKQKGEGEITITDKRMTRFWITLEQGVNFVIRAIEIMDKGFIFVPKMPSMKIVDLAQTIVPGCKMKIVGIRPGEKIHECLLTEDEARHSLEYKNFFIIEPEWKFWNFKPIKGGKKLLEDFRYSSDKNDWWLSPQELKKMVQDL